MARISTRQTATSCPHSVRNFYNILTAILTSFVGQTGLNDIGAVGNIIGALLNGYFTPKYGHRKVMLINLVAMTAFVFIVFFSPNLPCLLVGEFLCSIPWGVFTTMGPAYAAEVTPLALRGHLTAYVNLCWAVSAIQWQDMAYTHRVADWSTSFGRCSQRSYQSH